MKRFLAAMLIVSSLSAMAQKPDEPSAGTIDVIGKAEVSLEANYMLMQIVVEDEKETPGEAQEAVMSEMEAILGLLRGEEAVTEIKTQTVELRPRTDYKNKTKTYHARQSLSFQLMNLEVYESLIPALLLKGVDGIGRVEFKSTEQKKYERMLLQRALLDAREKAVMMAGELGQEVGKATYISDNMSRRNPAPVSAYMDGVKASGTIEPGDISLQATVNVHFELK